MRSEPPMAGYFYTKIRNHHVISLSYRESGLQKKPSQSIISPQTNSEMNNVSKFLSSVYSSPNSSDINRLYQPRSELRDVFLPPISSSNTMVVSKYSNQNNPHSPLTTKGTYLQDDQSKKSTNSIQDA